METVRSWLALFATLVRERNPDVAEALFASDVFSFGSVASVTRDLQSLRDAQWSKVWPVTRDFQFVDESLHITMSPDELMAGAFGQWTSEAVSTGARRMGRASIVLCRADQGSAWQAIHTHFSLSPAKPD